MLKSIRRIALCVALLGLFCVATPATAQADDFNTYWQEMANPPTPNPNGDFNQYWHDVQIQQEAAARQQ